MLALVLSTGAACAEVRVERLPEGALQPQAAVGRDGAVHLIYLTGPPRGCDIQYVRRRAAETNWSTARQVNSQPGSAVAIGTIRGPQLAVASDGAVHVCWNGSETATPPTPHGGAPLLYARRPGAGGGFEPARNLMLATHELDGGGSLTVDDDGRVFVAWHAAAAGGADGETNRAVFLARSEDGGRTFAAERPVSPAGSGACACCALKVFARPGGELFILFRAARSAADRGMMWLASRDHAAGFTPLLEDPWQVGQCPMSSAALASAGDGTVAAWETAGRIRFARFTGGAPSKIYEVPNATGAKHPVAAANRVGETLLVWTEGAGWNRGGSVAWQLFDAHGEPASAPGRVTGLSVWSYAAAVAEANGTFTVLF